MPTISTQAIAPSFRPGVEDGRHDQNLSVGGASGAAASGHASRRAAATHSSRPSIGIS